MQKGGRGAFKMGGREDVSTSLARAGLVLLSFHPLLVPLPPRQDILRLNNPSPPMQSCNSCSSNATVPPLQDILRLNEAVARPMPDPLPVEVQTP
jgi:hypothetical protein